MDSALPYDHQNKVQGKTAAERDTHRVSRVRGGPTGVSRGRQGGGSLRGSGAMANDEGGSADEEECYG